MRKFIIDTSSLIDLEKYYPYNIFPSLWDFLFEMFDEGRLFSVNEAYDELKDSQEVWKDYKNYFRDLTDEETEYLSEIMTLDKFEPFRRRGFKKTNGGPWADPYLVACGIVDDEVTVVSQESSRKHPHSVIPYVCGEYNVPCIKFLEFLRENNFKI